MSTLPGTSVLVTDLPDYPSHAPLPRAHGPAPLLSPGDDHEREILARQTGRPEIYCCSCSRPTTDRPRTTRSGATYCEACADIRVARYERAHPGAIARRNGPAPARERTGTAYLNERERFEARYHAGHRRWQIADSQTCRWTERHYPTEAGARAIAIVMNAEWRAQVGAERLPLVDRYN